MTRTKIENFVLKCKCVKLENFRADVFVFHFDLVSIVFSFIAVFIKIYFVD